MHLLLSIVARGLGRMSLEEQDALIPFLVDPGDNSGDLVATWLKKVVIAITSVVPDWVKASFMREWREQTQLSLLACALIFTGRRTTLDAHREWFLRLAAAAGDAFRRSADGPIIELQEAGGTQGRLVQTVQSPLLHAIDQPESGSPTELPTRELGPPAPAAERVDAAQLRDEGGGTGKRRRPTVAPELMRAADALAEVVQEQWEKAAEGRRLEYPGSIRVYWKKALAPVVGPVADALRSGAGVRRTGPLPGAAAQTVETLSGGEISSLLLVYCGLPSGRLVILGAPGAGKTATAIRLVLDVLSYRANFPGPRERAAVAVPVILTPHDWDPERQSVNVWLSQRVAADYPLLRSREYSSDTAAQLVDKGLVALVLDGLDDLSERARSVALRELDRQTRCRLVVLSRSAEMATAAAQAHMSAAVAVELRPVEPVEAADYLARCKVDPLPPDWQQLVDHLRRNPTSPVAQALDSPLMLGLVRDTYR